MKFMQVLVRFDLLYIRHTSSCSAVYAVNDPLTGRLAVFRISIKKGRWWICIVNGKLGEVADTTISYFHT